MKSFRVLSLVCLASVTLATPPKILAQDAVTAPPADGASKFATVVREHWAEWAGEAGVITPDRLDQLMKQRKHKGEAAAALAALKKNINDSTTKKPITFSMKRIDDYEAAISEHQGKKTYDKSFNKSRDLIAADPHALFATDAPHLDSIHQARNGDCWLLSTIGAMIHRDKSEIGRLITDDGQNHYDVHFAYHTFKVRAPTDSEIGAYTSDKADGDWLYVMENAVGQYREDFSKLHKVKEANDDALVGGSGALAFQDILGRNSDTVRMSPKEPHPDAVHKALNRAFKERRLVIVGTTHDKTIELPHGIAYAHCMAVLGWDAKSNTVHLWNPWGNNLEPKGTGPNAGYKTVSGHFSMPLTDFVRSFAYINIENDVPHKPTVPKRA